MPYSSFSLKRVQRDFEVGIVEASGLFAGLKKRELSQHLQTNLAENVSLALSINTEKARSELIIAPVLLELRRIFNREIGFFSGVELNVDRGRDLTGFCDFIITRSPEQLFVKSPIIAVVEAKNENTMGGLGQCAAEMVASRIYNERDGTSLAKTYGAVSSGNLWKFLELRDDKIFIDLDDYGIKEISTILGIFCSMVESSVSEAL